MLSLIIFLVGCILLVFKYAINSQPDKYYILEYYSDDNGGGSAGGIVLVENAPWDTKRLKKRLEDFFWRNITQDTLRKYKDDYGFYFFRQTKYLNKNFKEGGQYDPKFSSWDNTMDWRNHNKDRLGEIRLFFRDDKTGSYVCRIIEPSFLFNWLGYSATDLEFHEDFNDIEDFYKKKCDTLRIKSK